MKTKPFNLEAALAGAPVVNGQGDIVVLTKLALPDTDGTTLVAQQKGVGGVLSFNHADGRSAKGTTNYQLFMAPVKRTVYVNFYEYEQARWYATAELAKAEATSGRFFTSPYSLAVPVEIEG